MRKILTVLAVAAAALAVTAGTASATPQPSVHAVTHITDRPDGGNGSPDPYWADDSMHRSITITLTGGTLGAYTFTAKLKDKGTFTTIKGKQTPNQSGPYAGETVKSKVTGKMTGYADFSFTASALPSSAPNAGVPPTENDHGGTGGPATSTWYKLTFPAGTTFGGTGIGAWSWTYKVTVTTVTSQQICLAPHFCWPVPVVHVSQQQWIDAWNNNYGDDVPDGNISG